jgi:DNA polymerase I-like protein with 3'-5' exonuclease and polymerase domains
VAGHSWNYGAAAGSLSRNLGLSMEDAASFDQGMTESFRRLVAWKGEVREAAGAMPYGTDAPKDDAYRVLTNPFGRTVRVERARAYTQSVGLLCQSATRDSMMHAILKLPVPLRRKIKAFCHDEILVSVAKDRAEAISHEIADMMAFDLMGVPITFSGGDYGHNWAACYLD